MAMSSATATFGSGTSVFIDQCSLIRKEKRAVIMDRPEAGLVILVVKVNSDPGDRQIT